MSRSASVGRPAIREAVSRLKRDGLVESRRGSGAYVAPPEGRMVFRISPECFEKRRELKQVLELRTSVEADAAAFAATNWSAAQLRELERQLEKLEQASRQAPSPETIEQWYDAESAFYRTIAESSGNSFFVQFLQLIGLRIRMKLRTAALNNVRVAEMRPEVVAEHGAIFEAIRDKRPGAARQASRLHFSAAARRIAARKDLRD